MFYRVYGRFKETKILNLTVKFMNYCWLLVTCFFIFPVNAKQLRFEKHEKNDIVAFNYAWEDYQKQTQTISFELEKASLFSPFRNFRNYKPNFAAKYVKKSIKKTIQKKPFDNVHVVFNTKDDSVTLKSNNEDSLQSAKLAISQLELKFHDEYLDKNFYHKFETYRQERGIKPNHVSIADLSVPTLKPLKPIILETVDIQNIRRVTNYVLGFVQNIPYSTLESRVTSSGAGFSVPTKVLWENKGDCDSKMTLTIAILRALMPRIKMVMVYVERHAFIGIEILPKANDITLTEQGTTYVLADPTGPSVAPLGALSFESEQAILAGLYRTENAK